MNIKTLIGGMVALGLITMLGVETKAQRRICIVNERNNNVVCGREATSRERRRGRADNRFDRRDRGDYRYRAEVERNIDRLYRSILGRRADRGELRGYTNRVINQGWRLRRVREELASSDEARRTIARIGRNILGRRIDGRSIRVYQNYLATGWTLDRVRDDLRSRRDLRNRRRRNREDED